MSKRLLFLINLIIFISSINIAFAEIIPLKKPSQTKEVKEQKLLIDVLRPLPKPTIKKVVKEKDEKKPEEKIIVKKEKDLGILLPKKKPLIAGSKKEKETVKKSKYYSKKDFAIAKKLFQK